MTETATPPKDFAALKALIAERATDLPKRLTQIASFALDNPDEIAFGTVSSIAQQANVQPSTLVRFSQALGYQGFSDMQEVFRSRLRDRILNYDERIQQLREHALEASKPNVILRISGGNSIVGPDSSGMSVWAIATCSVSIGDSECTCTGKTAALSSLMNPRW